MRKLKLEPDTLDKLCLLQMHFATVYKDVLFCGVDENKVQILSDTLLETFSEFTREPYGDSHEQLIAYYRGVEFMALVEKKDDC